MTRGNQRELARIKGQKRQKNSKKACEMPGNVGLTIEQRKQRDIEALKEKQKKKEAME